MRSTTLVVWFAAVALCAGLLISAPAMAQPDIVDASVTLTFQNGGGDPDSLDHPDDSLIVSATVQIPIAYCDTVHVVLDPQPGLGIIPEAPVTYACTGPIANITGYLMDVVSTGTVDGYCVYNVRLAVRPEGICELEGTPVTFKIAARGVDAGPPAVPTCADQSFTRPLPAGICLGCGYLRYGEVCGIMGDGIAAIMDTMWLDTVNVEQLDDQIPLGTWEHDTVFVDARHITCNTDDDVMLVGDVWTVAPCATENGICGDTLWISVGWWNGSSTPTDIGDFDSLVFRYALCIRPIDNVPPEVVPGMIDSFQVRNGNAINDSGWVGCYDTLRIYMATDSSWWRDNLPWAFSGPVEGTEYTDSSACAIDTLVTNFDMSWIGVWLGDLIPSVDPLDYPHNQDEINLLCPSEDTLLWVSARFGTTWNPGTLNNIMWVDIPMDPELWADLQDCMDDIINDSRNLWLWGLDDAGNRSTRQPAGDSLAEGAANGVPICFDNVPPILELGSEIYLTEEYCGTKRFSPYDTDPVVRYFTNLQPDSTLWFKDTVELDYDDVFNDVYVIGFDVRVIPVDTAALVNLNWIHPDPDAVLPPDSEIMGRFDTMRWRWTDDGNADPYNIATFVWYGKAGEDSIDAPLSTAEAFWNCDFGGGLTTGFTFARWLDYAGCNRIIGSDYDGQTDIDENYTTRNQLRAVLDMCDPLTVTPDDTLKCTNLTLGSGPGYGVIPTYLWIGPNGVADDPLLRFRAKRNFAQNPFDVCLTEDTLYYRVRVDSIIVPGSWQPDTCRWYYEDDASTGTPDGADWDTITFNAGDVNAPVVEFEWGHQSGAGGVHYLPDGLYKLTLEVKDEAGNVYRDPIYIWLNGTGPLVDSLLVTNVDTVCTYNYYLGDTLCVWVRTDSSADAVLIDYSCIWAMTDTFPALDTLLLTTPVETSPTTKIWFGKLEVKFPMIDTSSSARNEYEVKPYELDCQFGSGPYILNVQALDYASSVDYPDPVTLITEPDPSHACDRAHLGVTPCPWILPPGSDVEMLFFGDPAYDQDLAFGADPDSAWHAISPGKIDSMGDAGGYHALVNWANDEVQDSIFVKLFIDSLSVNPDTLDTLVLQFINPNIYPPETEPRIRELRKPLCRPTSTSATISTIPNNSIYRGFIRRYPDNLAWIEFRYYWNATWFITAGEDSIMLVPYNERDTILVKAFAIGVDSVVIDGSDTTVYYSACPDTVVMPLDIDNINPDFRGGPNANNWTGVPNATGWDPNTGSTFTVLNMGVGADCGYRYQEGDPFHLKVLIDEPLHINPDAYPNDLGSHESGGYWPNPQDEYRGAFQISAIDRRTERLVNVGTDTINVVLDSVVVEAMAHVDSMYYHLYGHFQNIPAGLPTIYDSVALVIRSAWDEGGNPGRYNNPIYTDGLMNDSAEDTTFWVILQNYDPWAAGCPLVWGRPDSVLGWIAAEEDSVIVRATIIETPEIYACPPFAHEDSARVVEGNFQTITDDPDPWILPDDVGPWFLYITPEEDTLGWARYYWWYLRADSADLATIHCDGDYLPFTLHFDSYGHVNTYHDFNDCVQVDVNEPIWTSWMIRDSNLTVITTCPDPRQKIIFAHNFTDGPDQTPGPCDGADGVGVLPDMIWADLSDVLQDADADSVVPDSVDMSLGVAYWSFYPDAVFACIDSARAVLKFWALHDSLNHHDRELYKLDTMYFCSDCVPPHVAAVYTFCECDSATDFYLANMYTCQPEPLHYLSPGAPVNIMLCLADADHDSSSGINSSTVRADLSSIDSTLTGWTAWDRADELTGEPWHKTYAWGFDCDPVNGTLFDLDSVYANGDTIKIRVAFCDVAGNCDTVLLPIAIADSLPPIVDFVSTVGDDSIHAYVTYGDENVHIYADITGYPEDLVASPEHVWADLSRFWCDSTRQSWYDSVHATYIEQTGPDSYRAYWGWYPTAYWSTWDAANAFVIGHPVFGDSLVPGSDTLGTSDTLCLCADLGAEGYFDTLFFYVTDEACALNEHFSVFEVSGCDTTVPAVDFVEIYGNACHEGWISSTPMDSGHIEVWAFMDTVFKDLADTIRIDSLQANLAQLNPDYAWTQWGPGATGGTPTYGTAFEPMDPLQGHWEIVNRGGRDRLVAKWNYLTARDFECLDTVVVAVKGIRQTGLAGSHGYYIDVEYGWARVDTTRPYIYDMRVHSSTTSIAETTWVTPNEKLYVDVWVWDSNCDTITDDHLGFDTDDLLGPAPYITFCNAAGFDTIWSWDTTAFDTLYSKEDSLHKDWLVIRFTGYPVYNDTCNEIDLNDITGCIEAHIEDCLSNPAVPVQRSVTTDDVPPLYVNSLPWGDFTIVTGFPGDPDSVGVDSVLVLQNSVYGLDWDSTLFVYVIVDNKWNGDDPGDTLIRFSGTYIDFTGFMLAPVQYVDRVFYDIDPVNHPHRDSLVWEIPLYNGGPLFNVNVLSNRYWFPLVLADSLNNTTGDPWDEQPDPFPTTLFCDDLDSAVSFTIQNWNTPNPGMLLLCDSNTVAGSDTDFVDMYNMDLWNNEFVSPDAEMENLYKIYYESGSWAWYSHEDVNGTRFFIFVEDTVLQSDGIDNDADGLYDEVGEGVDFYTADLRVNGLPQVGHVDSMNVEGVWINYLWFADNFDQQRYDIDLYISDIYGHRDTLYNSCEGYNNALRFFEDESCPYATDLAFWKDEESRQIRVDDTFIPVYDLTGWTADDSMFVFEAFDSVNVIINDPRFLIANHDGSGPDIDTTTVDSINYNNGQASKIELLDPFGNPVVGFVQRYYDDATIFQIGALTLVDSTATDGIDNDGDEAAMSSDFIDNDNDGSIDEGGEGIDEVGEANSLEGMPDGIYTIRVTMLDRVGNSCVREWPFILDRTCPPITSAFTTRPGQNTPTDDLFTSWDYVEIVAHVTDSLDGVDSVHFEYCFDANRDGTLDAYPYWQVINILSDEGGAWDTDYPFIVYWNIRNLPWNSEDTLGLPPVDPDTCMNRYFVRVRAEDIYGHECSYVFPVDITDDIAPLAYIERIGRPGWGWDFTPQGAVVPCYNPNIGLDDSLIYVYAYDYIEAGFDPEPTDTFALADHWFDLAKGLFQYKVFDAPNVNGLGDPYVGWVNMWTPGEDTATYRNWFNERFIIQWNLKHPLTGEPLRSDQYNIRFVGIDVCDNFDALNTPVITVRLECDTTAPIAVICVPDLDAHVTNWHCPPASMDTGWVFVQAVSAIDNDLDSAAFYFVDSLSVPGLGIHTFIGGDNTPLVIPGATYFDIRWNTNNLLSGYYWLYCVAYDNDANFDTDPIWHRLYVDNTMPVVESCEIHTWTGTLSINDGDYFRIDAYAVDPDRENNISNYLFQYLNRSGNWIDLPNSTTDYDVWGMYGADIVTYDSNPNSYGWIEVIIRDFEQSPLDSIRFRVVAADIVDVGDVNWSGDYNRDCSIDRDLTCGTETCCMALEIRDQIPYGTNLWGYNHGNFTTCCLPYINTSTAITDCDVFSVCNDQNELDTLLLVAKVDTLVEDGWLMHFKFWREWPAYTDTLYVPNNTTLNPTIPATGPIVLYHTWDSVYVIWTDVRHYIDSTDNADGFAYSLWKFSAQTEDLTGNLEYVQDQNSLEIRFACLPHAPITHASYVANDVENPENRQRVFEAIPWADGVSADTIEVIYNRTTGPGVNDPEALVLLYTDASSIRNCRGELLTPFNVALFLLDQDSTLGQECPLAFVEPFGWLGPRVMDPLLAWDQYPPDDNMNDRYVVGFYLDNTFGPGVYNFAMVVRTDDIGFPWPCNNDTLTQHFYESDSDLDGNFDHDDSTRIDLVIRVVNVNEPQMSICYPEYGDMCVSGTVPMSARLLENPAFTGTIDTVWFQYFDGDSWEPITDPYNGRTYDTQADINRGCVRFELDESTVPDMAGWYYDMSGHNVGDPQYAWYAERDLFPDVAVWIEGYGIYPMIRDEFGLWRVDAYLSSYTPGCFHYSFIIDANDNNLWEEPTVDRWIRDPRAACDDSFTEIPWEGEGLSGITIPYSDVCLCSYMINFPSRDYLNTSYNFRLVVKWHDGVAYQVIENPSLGDSVHVFFVDNEKATAVHDIEFDVTRLAGGLLTPADTVCNPADTVWFVTDIQPLGTHDLVVEDICKVIYQVSLTTYPDSDAAWISTDTVWSNNDMGWTEAWPSYWVAWNPVADNIDNDHDGLVDETHDVQGGDFVGEENTKFWTRCVVVDYCGNTFLSNWDSIWVDVSPPEACITQVGEMSPADNQVVIVPPMDFDGSRNLLIIAQDMSYADQGVVAIFQYRKLNSGLPWKNIQAADGSNDTVRHVDGTFTAWWDITKYNEQCPRPDPEGWYQLRAIAIDTVGNSDACDNVICQITIRLNDTEPASRVEIYQIYSESSLDTAVSCMTEYLYIDPSAPYCVKAIYAATNIDTGMASLTFQYRSRYVEGDPSEWRNIETIWDHLDYGLNGDTTECVYFMPRSDELGEHGFDIRVIVEDYNGNDTSAVVTLYADESAPVGAGVVGPSIEFSGPCGVRCRLDITDDSALLTAIFEPDAISGEINVDDVWFTMQRDDATNQFASDPITRVSDDTWQFNFGGDLCSWMAAETLDMGCYYFTLHFDDCVGNANDVPVTTTCGEGDPTTLVCIDCDPDLPELATLDSMQYNSWDCASPDSAFVTIVDHLLDDSTEIGGDQIVDICGHLPSYQQYIRYVWMFVESEEAGVESTLVDTYEWVNTSTSASDTHYCFEWGIGEKYGDDVTYVYPSGYYRVWVLAVDAICQIQSAEPIDEFWVHVDHGAPIGEITRILDRVPNPVAPDTFEVETFFGNGTEGGFWVEWWDGLTPDDSTQAHNQVQMWAKNQLHPNQADAWHMVGRVPSPCNPHWIVWAGEYSCGEVLDLVVVVQDRWFNGDLDVEAAMQAYAEGRWVDIYLTDTNPPATELWSIGLTDDPTDAGTVMMDQQNQIIHLTSTFWDQDVYLHVFASGADVTLERVHFQFSLDSTTWFDMATDYEAEVPDTCTGMTEPLPWWCEYAGPHGRPILWTALWDISGLRGHVWVRTWAQDICGNTEDYNVYEVTIDVMAPMAKVFVWESNVNVDNLPCTEWTEPQIPDTLEIYRTLTVGACPDSVGTVHYDAYGAFWYYKRADANPLDGDVWYFMGDDSTGPFSKRPVDLWNRSNNYPEPQVGDYYDVAVLMTDQHGHMVPWVQFLYTGQGTTLEEKWQDLINRGYVKRFRVTDHTAPVAYNLMVTTDCTPDSSVIFVHGNVNITAMCMDPDVVAVTFAVREHGAEGPWTIIERVVGDSGTTFRPAETIWNTELLNGTYVLGAFAEDYYGNRDGDPNVADLWPTYTLTVNVDNQIPNATITQILRNDLVVTELERGAVHTFDLNASDNFGLRQVALFFRHAGGDPTWRPIGLDTNWPYSFNWLVPETLVVGWTYEFAAVATDLCGWTDLVDGQGNYIVDGAWPIVDNETYLAIYTIGGQNAETVPHVHGTNVCIQAHSEPRLDHVRFLYVLDGDTTEIGTVADTLGITTTWDLCGWDVTTLAEGPAQLCAVGSADLGGDLVTMAVDCRNIVIDHSLPYVVDSNLPVSHGLLSLQNCQYGVPDGPDLSDLWIKFVAELTDPDIDTVWFEWKYAAGNDDPERFWHPIGVATLDQGLTGRWAYDWGMSEHCGLYALRARVSDNAVPTSNEALVIFADSVRIDNQDPTVAITNINGDVTPAGTEIPYGQVANIVATVTDPFCQGGNSAIDTVAFYMREALGMLPDYSVDTAWVFLGGDGDGAPWQTLWNTSTHTPGEYQVRAVAWDEAGNCSETVINIYIVDQLYQRAWIIGFDADDDPWCDDRMWAITDDCPPNYTSYVRFQYSTDQGMTWVSLGEDQEGEPYCDDCLDYNIWEMEFEFDFVPQGAIFRAVATDESNNDDPSPPRFMFSDVTSSPEAVIYNQDLVRLHVTEGQVPWVSSLLEQAPPDEDCFTQRGLVCVNPVEGDPTGYAGLLDESTRPCNLDNRDGKVTVYAAVPVTRGDFTYMVLNKYELDIHQTDQATGSNGWLTSEDEQLQMYVAVDGVTGDGTAWFEPAADFEVINMLPPGQYYYTMLSDVEYVMTENLTRGQHEARFRMRFDPTLVPEGAEDWSVVATYYDRSSDLWLERGIIYETRDLQNGLIEFYFPCCVEWNMSNEILPDSCNPDVCPNKIAFAIMYTTVRPIDEWVRFANYYCDLEPDSTYYTPERGPTVGCDVTWWAILRQGEYTPAENTIDVYLDGIRIINDGRPDSANGYGWDAGGGQRQPLFYTSYSPVSGVYAVRFTYEADYLPPWYASGCLRNGAHTIQFYADNLHTHLTPFWVDRTEPEAWTYPEYINHQINLWANLTDCESMVDTTSAYAVISDCTPDAFSFRALIEVDTLWFRYYDTDSGYIDSMIAVIDSFTIGFEVIINDPARAFVVESEAMTFTPIECGYKANFSMQWEALHQWLIQNNNAGQMCVTWQFHNGVCEWNDSTTYVYTIDVEPPLVIPVSPVGAAIDDDGDGVANEDWHDCLNNDNDWWWDAEFAHWQERIDEDPINFESVTFNYGERPPISAVLNDIQACQSGAAGINVPAVWLTIDGRPFTAADTSNEGLNFHILWPYGQQDDAFLTFGGIPGEALNFAYKPGTHTVVVAAPDSAGNVGTNLTWTYEVRAMGPAIVFDETVRPCGLWFNPEVSNIFEFDVNATSETPIRANGIMYTVKYVPSGERISGPTTINPADPLHHHVAYNLSGSFPDGQSGIEIVVAAYNILFDSQVDTINGATYSAMTFWADNLQPTFTSHVPETDEVFTRDEAIVIEVFYTDDSPEGLVGGGSGEKGASSKSGTATLKVSKVDKTGKTVAEKTSSVKVPAGDKNDKNRGLDANGSGIKVSSFGMTIIPPNGVPIQPTLEDFVELDAAHAKYVLTPGQPAGRYTVDVRVEDCVGNIGVDSWSFYVQSAGPAITFVPVEGECQWPGYWNPNTPLKLNATITELDNINTARDGITVDIVRVYECDQGLCEETMVHNANYAITPEPSSTDRAQTFTITGSYNLDHEIAAVELRIVITAVNALGATSVSVQPWIVDNTPPWITIVAPMPDAVLPESQPVTITANFGDNPDGVVAVVLPGTEKGKTTLKVGPARTSKSDTPTKTKSSMKSALGAWGGVVGGGNLDDLDGNSGIDRDCIELLLMPRDGGEVMNLTEEATITPNAPMDPATITWTDNLGAGSYTAILSVCDHVCNTASVNWDFVVAADNAGVVYEPPYYVSSVPHTFVMHTFGDNIDHASARLYIEGAVMVEDSLGGHEMWVPVVEGDAVQWNENEATYVANFDLAAYHALRLTLRLNFTYGVPVPASSQVYTVDTGAPIIVSVTPSPEAVIPVPASPTFTVEFAEVGNTALDSATIHLWLETINSVAVEGEYAVTLDGARRTAVATLEVSDLGIGDYRLYAEASDIAGNRVAENWVYMVRDTTPIPAEILDRESAHNYPNPFEYGEATTFWLPITPGVGAYAEIKIYDFGGQLVKELYNGYVTAAPIEWHGENDAGERVANGVYLARVVTTAQGKTKEDIVKVAFKNKQ